MYDLPELNAVLASEEKQAWKSKGNCRGCDPDLFFPQRGQSTKEAKAICNGTGEFDVCPVKEQCLDWAVEQNEKFGIWGGKSERERRVIRRIRKTGSAEPGSKYRGEGVVKMRAEHGTDAGYRWERLHQGQRLGNGNFVKICDACRTAHARLCHENKIRNWRYQRREEVSA